MQPRRVAVLCETSNVYSRGLLRGILRHANRGRGWAATFADVGPGEPLPTWMLDLDFDGVIARIPSHEVEQLVRSMDRPVVNLTAPDHGPCTFPTYEVDNASIAKVAAAHFGDRGFRATAFLGDPRYGWSRERGDAFVAECRGNGWSVQSFATSFAEPDWTALGEWLRSLPRPCGMLCAHDHVAKVAMRATSMAGVTVPTDLAVLGVDNDELICGLTTPAISSVGLNAVRTGCEAAAALDRAMDGEKLPIRLVAFEASQVHQRDSTRTHAIADRLVAEAMDWIELNYHTGHGIERLVQEVGGSRRSLEQRFRATLGTSIYQLMLRRRMGMAMRMLAGGAASVEQIANETGFSSSEHFCHAFRKRTGMTPSEFRSAQTQQFETN